MKGDTLLMRLSPVLVAVLVILGWEWAVAAFGVSKFVLPAPSAILDALVKEWPSLLGSALVTVRITAQAFV